MAASFPEKPGFDCQIRRALIVDNNIVSRKMTKRVLQKFSFDYDEAATFQEAIDILQDSYAASSVDEGYDIVFLDHIFVDNQGSSKSCGEILREASSPSMPICLLSNGMSDGEPISDFSQVKEESGVSAILLKPMIADEVYGELLRLKVIISDVNNTDGGGRSEKVWPISPQPPTKGEAIDVNTGIRKYRSARGSFSGDNDLVAEEKSPAPTHSYPPLSSPTVGQMEREMGIENLDNICSKSKKQILIADDSCTCRKVLSRHVQLLGFEPVSCQNGLEALELLKKQEFVAILMDLSMPKLDGISTTHIIRDELKSKTPIIIISSLIHNDVLLEKNEYLLESKLSELSKSENALLELMSFAVNNGADYAMKKPVTVGDLSQVFEKLQIMPSAEDFHEVLVAVESESPQMSPNVKALIEMRAGSTRADSRNVRRSRSSFASADEYMSKESNESGEGNSNYDNSEADHRAKSQEHVGTALNTLSGSSTAPSSDKDDDSVRDKARDLDELVKSYSAILKAEEEGNGAESNHIKVVSRSSSQRQIEANSFCADGGYDDMCSEQK